MKKILRLLIVVFVLSFSLLAFTACNCSGNHSWTEFTITKEATCTADGEKTSKCTKCGETKTEVIGKIEHSWNNGEVTQGATCVNGEEVTYTCTVCGQTKTECSDILTEHVFGEWTITKAPTCADIGETERVCIVCGTKETAKVSPLAHTSSDWIVNVAPTCTAVGSRHKECTVCGVTLAKEEVAATGHTEVIDEAVAPTCTTSGKTEGKHCSVCNTVIVEQQEVPAIGHISSEWIVDFEATCTSVGSRHKQCTVCGVALETQVLAKLPHTEVVDKAVAATCTKSGKTEGKHCSVCNIVLVAQQEIPAKGHSWNSGRIVKEPTCTEKGSKSFHCSACGQNKTEQLAALGHDLLIHKAKAPTCTEVGWNSYRTCTRCNYTTYQELAATGHNFVFHEGKAPTCTQNGTKEHFECTVCRKLFVGESAPKTEISATELVVEIISHVDANADGICDVCNQTLAELHAISVDVNSSANAHVLDLSADRATDGTTFTFKVSVDDGYTLAEVTINGIEVTASADGIYTGTVHGDTIIAVQTAITVETWVLVTDVSTLSSGDTVIIAAKHYDFALSIVQSGGDRAQTVISKNGNVLVAPDVLVQKFKLQSGLVEGLWTFYDENNDGYICATDVGLENSQNAAQSAWTIEIDSLCNATIVSQSGCACNQLRYNAAIGCFSCYENGQDDVVIYKLIGG